jgi:hypothetical protein
MKSVIFFITGLVFLAPSPRLCAQQIFVLAAFDRSPATAAVQWMEEETARAFSEAGVTFRWRPGSRVNMMPAGALTVSVQFHRLCRLEPDAISPAIDGPLGWVESQEGEIGALINADCDRIAAMVWQDRGTLPLPLVVRAYGRALGRVLAHELYHYITQSAAHNRSHLLRHAMTSRDLMLPEVQFEQTEVEALRKAMSSHQAAVAIDQSVIE